MADPDGPGGGRRAPLRRRKRSRWEVFGMVVGVCLVLGGVAVVGFSLMVTSALNNWGSNK
ncbi:hypothetical protein GCM10009839_48630 [Catenulispora yoronensis]|uniref:Uncharacterized protein n=1 Tax=Catenulispora yoronensis TaxID=450799 RepID=A0ABN2UNC2_9ACTN